MSLFHILLRTFVVSLTLTLISCSQLSELELTLRTDLRIYCDDKCICNYFNNSNHERAAIIDCSRKGLLNLPTVYLHRTDKLFLQLNDFEPNGFNPPMIYKNDFSHVNLTHLRFLDLSGNKLHAIEEYAFAKLKHLRELNLSNNSFTYLSVHIFPEGLKLQLKVNVANNTGLNVKELKEKTREFSSLILIQGNTNNSNTCTIKYTRVKGRLTHGSCADQHLTDIPKDIDKHIERLNLKGNEVTELKDNMFGNNMSLKHLNLAHNNINLIHDNALIGLHNLKVLDLSNNNISRDSFQIGVFKYTTKLHELNLKHNINFNEYCKEFKNDLRALLKEIKNILCDAVEDDSTKVLDDFNTTLSSTRTPYTSSVTSSNTAAPTSEASLLPEDEADTTNESLITQVMSWWQIGLIVIAFLAVIIIVIVCICNRRKIWATITEFYNGLRYHFHPGEGNQTPTGSNTTRVDQSPGQTQGGSDQQTAPLLSGEPVTNMSLSTAALIPAAFDTS